MSEGLANARVARATPAAPTAVLWPTLALVLNAFIWGVSWWPFRQLQERGLHPLWATVLIFLTTLLVISAWRPGAWRQLWQRPSLWLLVVAAGATNATLNWAVTIGDVVRVILLFYLMPLWAVLLARWLLGELIRPVAMLRVALALAGAGVVLWPAQGGWPLPHTLAEWLAIVGGFSFALNNVLLRREAHQPESARALAVFLGGALVAGLLALSLTWQGTVPALPALHSDGRPSAWVWGVAAMSLLFLVGKLALQYGAAHLPANVTAVILIIEVLFASASAVWLGAGAVTAQLALGGALIVMASLLAARH